MIHLDVVTPTKKLVEGASTTSVKLPAAQGDIEVLPGHADLLALIGTGILAFRDADGKERRFAISYGFAEVRRDRVTILAETCEEAGHIDKARAAKAKESAEKHLAGKLTPETFRKYELKLQRAIVRQKL